MSDPRQGWTSASNALEDSLCVGRHLAQAGLEDIGSEDSTKGDRIHAALAGWVNPTTLSFEEREMFDACRDLERKQCIDYFGETPSPVRVIREAQDGSTRLWVRFEKDGKQMSHSGQPDVVFRCGTRALVMEYKTGHNEVAESSSNMQLRDQAVLVYGNHTLLEEIATVVIQPLITTSPQICIYDKEALNRSQFAMYDRIVASNTTGAKRTPGEKQCQYCRAKNGHCVEYQQFAGQLAPPAMLQLFEVPFSKWTAQQMAAAADALSPAQKFLDELKAFLKEALKVDASFVPGWTLKNGSKIETISDPQACFDRFAQLGGKLEQFMPVVKVGKTKLREAVASVTSSKGKALDKKMAELTAGIVEVKENEPSLVKLKEGK